VYYPTAAGTYPVIAISPGYTAQSDDASRPRRAVLRWVATTVAHSGEAALSPRGPRVLVSADPAVLVNRAAKHVGATFTFRNRVCLM